MAGKGGKGGTREKLTEETMDKEAAPSKTHRYEYHLNRERVE